MRTAVALAALALFFSSARVAAQAPDERGSLAISEWDAGSVRLDTAMIPVQVYYPSSGGPYPVVGVIHGASRTGAEHAELGRTLASRGFVALVPDMPCGFTGCNHDANQRQLTALFVWGVAQSEMAGSMLSGKIDGERRGLIGHSWGGLASHLTAARDPTIDSVVLFDPNDDAGVGLAASGTITAPVLQLLAEVPGSCNSQWNEAMVSARLPAPEMQLVVSGSGHCDPEEPQAAFCDIVCAAGSRATSQWFRRYAVAWTQCVLTSDAAMAPWLGGASMMADVSGGRIESVMEDGLAMLPCRSGPIDVDAGAPVDGGGEPVDGGGEPVDSGTTLDEDGGGTPRDASTPGRDARVIELDAGGGASSGGGCGCRASPARGGAWLAVIALAFVIARRRAA